MPSHSRDGRRDSRAGFLSDQSQVCDARGRARSNAKAKTSAVRQKNNGQDMDECFMCKEARNRRSGMWHCSIIAEDTTFLVG